MFVKYNKLKISELHILILSIYSYFNIIEDMYTFLITPQIKKKYKIFIIEEIFINYNISFYNNSNYENDIRKYLSRNTINKYYFSPYDNIKDENCNIINYYNNYLHFTLHNNSNLRYNFIKLLVQMQSLN